MSHPPAFPLEFLDIELTERCNLHCVHCYINRPAADPAAQAGESTPRLLKRLLKEARALGCREVRFTGGEPLLYDGFAEIYRFAASNGFRVWLASNATLIDERTADLFLQYPPAGVNLSIYGWDAPSYERTTITPRSFLMFVNGVQRLRRSGIRFGMKMPAVPWLLENRASVETVARSLGAAGELPFVWELSLRARHDPHKSQRIRALRLDPAAAAELILSDSSRRLERKQALASYRRPVAPDKRLFRCRAGKRRLTVNAYGELQVCLEMRHPRTTYDLWNGTLRDALQRFVPTVRAAEAENPEYLRRCAICPLRRLCAQCPACSWMEHGTLDTPIDYYCRIAHLLSNSLGDGA